MVCHQGVLKESPAIRRLAALPADAVPFPASGVRRMPDFVLFSHGRHAVAQVNCDDCHGKAYESDTAPSAPRTMKACMDCHQARKATVVCNACHELGQ